MNRLLLFIHSFLLFGLYGSAQGSDDYDKMLTSMYKKTVPIITPKELNAAISSNENVLLLDTREKKEYNVSHIENAEFVGYSNFSLRRLRSTPKDTKIIVYCSVGYRSERIGEKLQKAGFTNVSNLYGGIFEWKNNGFSVYKDNSPTEKVHAYSQKWGVWLKKGEKVYD